MSKILSIAQMKKVNLVEIKENARVYYYDLWETAKQYSRDVKLYLHWTAGRYGQFWDEYHIQIDADGSLYMPKGAKLTTVLSGTYKRNSGSISIALLGCYDATTGSGLGSNPPTQKQIESMARVIAVLAKALDLTIDIKRVMTHGEAADNEDGLNPDYESNGYENGKYGPKHGCERWDLEYLGTPDCPVYDPYGSARGGDILRGKAAWYCRTYPDGVEKHFNRR